VHFAAGLDDLPDVLPDDSAVAVVLLRQLAEAGGVQVQPFDVDPNLIGPQLGSWIELPGRLRKQSDGRQHPVQAERRASRAWPIREVWRYLSHTQNPLGYF
jgi:hypothetical protein